MSYIMQWAYFLCRRVFVKQFVCKPNLKYGKFRERSGLAADCRKHSPFTVPFLFKGKGAPPLSDKLDDSSAKEERLKPLGRPWRGFITYPVCLPYKERKRV